MKIETIGILAGAAAIGFLIYQAAKKANGSGSSTITGLNYLKQAQTTQGEGITLFNKNGYILDQMGRVWA